MAKKSTIRKDYLKARQKLQRQVRSMEKRGYSFDKNPVPDTVKKPTKASINRLQKIQSQLYEKAHGYVEGERVTGKQFRGHLRRESAKKAVETRERRKRVNQELDEEREYWENFTEDYEDTVSYSSAEPSEAEAINLGDAVIETLRDCIRTLYEQGKSKSARELDYLLAGEIRTYGEDAVAKSLAPFETEVATDCEVLIQYGKGSDQHQTALIELEIIIRGGEAPTSMELQRMSEAFEDEDATDSDIEGFQVSDISWEDL